ncbi:hypothetical protein TNCV_3645281 [Trichonephila clavipes]|nr:hypothetical protein TNCV_3645281 [Trichonephila clavipes]
MGILPHSPYSPDMAPSYFFVSTDKEKSEKKEIHSDVDEVKENTLTPLYRILPPEFPKSAELLSSGKSVG